MPQFLPQIFFESLALFPLLDYCNTRTHWIQIVLNSYDHSQIWSPFAAPFLALINNPRMFNLEIDDLAVKPQGLISSIVYGSYLE